MGLRVIGAGLPRTGTTSLKQMLEELLGGGCYHMSELYKNPDVDGPMWMDALDGDVDRLDDVLDGWVAAVDWPASVMWRELSERHPDALVVLSHRGTSEQWWTSADRTVWDVMRQITDGLTPEHVAGIHQLMRDRSGFAHDLEEGPARDRYDSHLAEVEAAIPAERLLVWQPSQGWEPLCERLGLPVPDEAPAHANTGAEFRSRHRSDQTSDG